MKRWFYKHKAGKKEFEVGDLVLKWDHSHDEKGKHTKFQQLWVGPFHIAAKLGPSTYKLKNLQGREENLPINGLVLKPYFSLFLFFVLYINKLIFLYVQFILFLLVFSLDFD